MLWLVLGLGLSAVAEHMVNEEECVHLNPRLPSCLLPVNPCLPSLVCCLLTLSSSPFTCLSLFPLQTDLSFSREYTAAVESKQVGKPTYVVFEHNMEWVEVIMGVAVGC